MPTLTRLTSATPSRPVRARHPGSLKVTLLFARAMLHEFRGTLLALAAAVVVGAVVILLTPAATVEGQRPGPGTAFYAAWMAMLGEFVTQGLPSAPHLMVLFALYPVLGFVLIGEGVVRLAILMVSRKYGHKEWTKVAASTYRDHVILCGLGHLGYRVLEELLAPVSYTHLTLPTNREV